MSLFTVHDLSAILDQYQNVLDEALKIYNVFEEYSESNLLAEANKLEAEIEKLRNIYDVDLHSLGRHLHYLLYYLSENDKASCKKDITDIVTSDLPEVMRNILRVFKNKSHYEQELQDIITARIGARHYGDIVRNSFIILTDRLRRNFKQNNDMDGVDLVNLIFGAKSQVRLPDGVAKGEYRDLLSGLYQTFRDKYAHNQSEPEQAEFYAIVEMVNHVLLTVDKWYDTDQSNEAD